MGKCEMSSCFYADIKRSSFASYKALKTISKRDPTNQEFLTLIQNAKICNKAVSALKARHEQELVRLRSEIAELRSEVVRDVVEREANFAFTLQTLHESELRANPGTRHSSVALALSKMKATNATYARLEGSGTTDVGDAEACAKQVEEDAGV